MKSILYVGATLMIGASIYGFVDYKQNRNKKEFKEMYGEEKAIVPVEIINDKHTASLEQNDNAEKQAVSNKKLAITKNPAISKEETFNAIKPNADDEKVAPAETKVTSQVSNNNGVEKKIKKKRKFSTKLFSRGALDERYVNPKEKVEIIKEDPKKTESKEQ